MASIRKEGKYYYIYFYLGKKLRKRSLRTASKREAEKILWKFESELKMKGSGNYIGQSKDLRLKPFFEEVVRYSRINKSPNTTQREEQVFKNFLDFCRNTRLEDINFRLIEAYKEHLLVEKGFQPSGVNIELRHLSAAFSVAVKYEYLNKNPFRGVTKLRVPKKIPVFLTPDQALNLLNYTKDRSIYAHILIALNTGARASEVLNLKWNDIDLQNRILRLYGKGSKERTVPIPCSLFDFLKVQAHNGEYITSGTRRVDTLSSTFRRIADRVGLYGFTFHNLRDTYASWLVQQGVSLKVIQELLGHESITTTLIYAHLSPDSRFVAIRVIDEQLNYPQKQGDGFKIKESVATAIYMHHSKPSVSLPA